MYRIRDHEHRPEPLRPAVDMPCMRRGAVHVLPPWLWDLLRQQSCHSLFGGRGDAPDVLGAEYVDGGKGDREVGYGEHDVHAERIPAIRLYEVFQPL